MVVGAVGRDCGPAAEKLVGEGVFFTVGLGCVVALDISIAVIVPGTRKREKTMGYGFVRLRN